MKSFENDESYLIFKTGRSEYTKVLVSDILYFKADGNYTHIIMKTGDSITISKSLKHTLEKIETDLFIKINRGVVVNKLFIIKLRFGNEPLIKLINGQKFRPSKRHHDEIKQLLFTE